jgi:hypothetical protein
MAYFSSENPTWSNISLWSPLCLSKGNKSLVTGLINTLLVLIWSRVSRDESRKGYASEPTVKILHLRTNRVYKVIE